MHKDAATTFVRVLLKHYLFQTIEPPARIVDLGLRASARGTIQMKRLSDPAANTATLDRAVDVLKQQMLDVENLRKMVTEAERLAALRAPSSADDIRSSAN